MRRNTSTDERVETEARRIATLLAESAPMAPEWSDLPVPAVDLEKGRGGMRHNTFILVTSAFAAAVIAIALVVTIGGGSGGDGTTVVDQPFTPADAPADTPAEESGTQAPEPSVSRIPSTSTTTPVPVLDDALFQPSAMTRIAVDPSGGLTAVYWDADERSIEMLRCFDTACVSPRDVVTLGPGSTFRTEGEDYGPVTEAIAFTPDGTPIVLLREGDGESYTSYACDDPSCESVSTVAFYEKESTRTWGMIGEPQVAVATDGTPRVAYFDRDAEALMLAICEDLVCSPETRSVVVVHDDVFTPAQISLRILPDGRTFFGYETGTHDILSANAAVCSDDTCSTGATVHEFDNAVGPRFTFGEDGEFSVWYRSGPLMVSEGDYDPEAFLRSWDLMVADCDDAGCQDPRLIEADWKSLFAWGTSPDDLLLLQSPEQLFVAYATWSPEACNTIVEIAEVDVEHGAIGPVLEVVTAPLFTGSVTEDGQAVVVYLSGESLHSIDLRSDLPEGAMGPAAAAGACGESA